MTALTRNDPISRALDDLHRKFIPERGGTLPDYIPELAKADPDMFGISLVSVEGHRYSAGDAERAFTIQSISKPFVYALALEDLGLEAVLERVGAEPSGKAFNAISLEKGTGRPANPMVNAGAILTTSLVRAATDEERFYRIREAISAFAGRSLELDEAVYRSERDAGDRNRALAYLMKSAGALRADVEATVDVYFRQCALLVTADDLAMMAATLANGGVHPLTKERVVSDQAASHVLTLMGSCGMYDYAGEWLLRVGLPAKSGVAGGVMAVKPSQFGIGLVSPLLDARGNSVRAVAACQELATRFELHLLNQVGQRLPAASLGRSGGDCRSSQVRNLDDERRLATHGDAIRVVTVQGDVGFAGAEQVLHACGRAMPVDSSHRHRWLILDLTQVGQWHRVAQAMVTAVIADLRERDVTAIVCDTPGRDLLPGSQWFGTVDEALRWCEDDLLATDSFL